MTKCSSLLAAVLLLSAPVCAAQTSPAKPQIDSNWLTVDTTGKTATFQLISGLTPLNSGLNFNGFNDGKLTLTVPTGWTVVIRFTNHDANLPHSAEVVDTTKPMPAGPVDPPVFAHAMTAKPLTGIPEGASDSLRFVASKAGSYMIFCAVSGHGLAGMWIRLKVSATEKRPTLVAS